MRDPHIIIGAFIERYQRENGIKLKLIAIPKKHGGFRASVEGNIFYASAAGVSLDAALQYLAVEVESGRNKAVRP